MEDRLKNSENDNLESQTVREDSAPFGEHGAFLFRRDAVTSQDVQRFVKDKLPRYGELYRKLAE
ncbi:hypothetical protein BH09SUM1_BH09SUM1_23440 [soil metagenome]